MQMHLLRTFPILLAFLPPLPVAAQANISEVMQQSGVKLSAEELKALLPGSAVSGFNNAGGQFSMSLNPDGSMSGNTSVLDARRGAPAGLSGTWRVSDEGKYCYESTNLKTKETDKRCVSVFRAGDAYFMSGGDAPNSPVVRRVIRK